MPDFSVINGFAQGTTYHMVFEKSATSDPQVVKEGVDKLLHRFDMSLSLWIDSSVVSRINLNQTNTPDSFFTAVFNKSKAISELTDGAFDVTVGPLVEAWGFGPDERKNFSEEKKDSLMQLVGMWKVEIRDGKIVKADPHISLDFNAIAQGYSVDVVCGYFDSLGMKDYLVEIGGEVRVKGDKRGKLWTIGIDKPVDNNMIPGSELEARISLKDKALATSGNYRKFYIENGIKYSHTINPKTGYPAKNNLLSATIIADDCATADGIATACMVIGKDKALDFLAAHPEFSAYLIYSDNNGNFRTWTSEALKKYISESDQ